MNNNETTDDSTPILLDADTFKDEALVRVVIGDYEKARQYIKNHYQQVWSNCFKAYNGIRTRRGYSGVADEFVPETFAIVEALKSAIAGTRPKFKYIPLREEQEQDTVLLNELVNFYWSQNNMTEKLLNWVGDMIIYGNGILMVSWEEDRPLIQHIPLTDFFVDPAATHMNRPEEPGYARFAGYRYLTSLAQLKAENVPDVDTGEMVPKYKNLDNIGQWNGEDDQMDKDRKERFLGSTYGKEAYKEQVEVIVYFSQRKKVMIANRSTIILDETNPYHREEQKIPTSIPVAGDMIKGFKTIPEIKGFLPFAILRNYVDSNLFFARGDVEVMLPSQEALNDTASQKRDNVAYALNNMWQIDPRFKHMIEQIESVPGAVFPIPKGALTPIEKSDVSPSADMEINRLTQQMRTATAADAAVQGIRQQHSRTSATEIQAQLTQAQTRFTTKVQTLEDEGFAQLARIIYKMIQIFVTEDIAVRVAGDVGVTWQTYKPGTYNGEYEPRVTLESTMRAEKAIQAQNIQSVLQFGLNNPMVNQGALLKEAFQTILEIPQDRIDELLTPPAPPIMGPDGQAVDPALAQSGDTQVTPDAAALLRGTHAAGVNAPQAPVVVPESKRLVRQAPTPMISQPFSATPRGKATQTGRQGGGGSATANGNAQKPKSDQPSTVLSAKK